MTIWHRFDVVHRRAIRLARRYQRASSFSGPKFIGSKIHTLSMSRRLACVTNDMDDSLFFFSFFFFFFSKMFDSIDTHTRLALNCTLLLLLAHLLIGSVWACGKIGRKRSERKRPFWMNWASSIKCAHIRTAAARRRRRITRRPARQTWNIIWKIHGHSTAFLVPWSFISYHPLFKTVTSSLQLFPLFIYIDYLELVCCVFLNANHLIALYRYMYSCCTCL